MEKLEAGNNIKLVAAVIYLRTPELTLPVQFFSFSLPRFRGEEWNKERENGFFSCSSGNGH